MPSTLEGGPHNKYDLEYLYSSQSKLRLPPELIGESPAGLRLIVYREGGELVGPRLRGRFLPVGGDWLIVRPDGMGVVDARGTIETHDGALIYNYYSGLADFGENALEQIRRGQLPPAKIVRTLPRFETSHPDYLWLNRVQAVGIAQVNPDLGGSITDVYALR